MGTVWLREVNLTAFLSIPLEVKYASARRFQVSGFVLSHIIFHMYDLRYAWEEPLEAAYNLATRVP